MNARAFVQNNFVFRGIDVFLGFDTDAGMLIVRPDGNGDDTYEEAVPAGASPANNAPSLRLRDDLARALLDALAVHYGGTGDTRTLRKDYEHERGRVDSLISHLMGGRGV